jgi:hypothetical protein
LALELAFSTAAGSFVSLAPVDEDGTSSAGINKARIGLFRLLEHRLDSPESDLTIPGPVGVLIRSPTLAARETQWYPSSPVMASDIELASDPGRIKNHAIAEEAKVTVQSNKRARTNFLMN